MVTGQDKKMNIMLWIVGIAFGTMLGIGGTVTLSYGATKNQVEVNSGRIDKLEKTSVNYIYLEELVQSNIMVVDIGKAKQGSPELEKALQEWKDFQMNTMRKANPTRGGTAQPNSIK